VDGNEYSFPLNRINTTLLVDAMKKHGIEDTEELIGKTLYLKKDKVIFQGKVTDGLRIGDLS